MNKDKDWIKDVEKDLKELKLERFGIKAEARYWKRWRMGDKSQIIISYHHKDKMPDGKYPYCIRRITDVFYEEVPLAVKLVTCQAIKSIIELLFGLQKPTGGELL